MKLCHSIWTCSGPKTGLQYQKNLPYSTEVQWDISDKAGLSPPVGIFLLAVTGRCFFCGSFLLVMFRACDAFLSVHCGLVVTCRERAGLLALLCVVFSCVFVASCVVS